MGLSLPLKTVRKSMKSWAATTINCCVLSLSVVLVGLTPGLSSAQSAEPRNRAEARQMAREAAHRARIAADEATAAAAEVRAKANAARDAESAGSQSRRQAAPRATRPGRPASAPPIVSAPAPRPAVARQPAPQAPVYAPTPRAAPPVAVQRPVAAQRPAVYVPAPPAAPRPQAVAPARAAVVRPRPMPMPAARVPAGPVGGETQAQFEERKRREIADAVMADLPRVEPQGPAPSVIEARETGSSYTTEEGLVIY